LILEPAVKPNV